MLGVVGASAKVLSILSVKNTLYNYSLQLHDLCAG